MDNQAIKVLLVEDHKVMVEGLSEFINKEENLMVVAQFNNGQTAISQLDHINYDVLLCDIKLPGKNGLSVCREAKNKFPNRKVLLMSTYNEALLLADVRKSKTDGFISKDYSTAKFLEGIKSVSDNKPYFLFQQENTTPNHIKLSGGKSATDVFDKYVSTITKREKEILGLYAKGFKDAKIGKELDIAKETVLTYKRRLYKKLGAKDMQDLMRICWECGLM